MPARYFVQNLWCWWIPQQKMCRGQFQVDLGTQNKFSDSTGLNWDKFFLTIVVFALLDFKGIFSLCLSFIYF